MPRHNNHLCATSNAERAVATADQLQSCGDLPLDRRQSLPLTAVALLQTGPLGSEHERQVHLRLAEGIGKLLGLPFAGVRHGSLAEPHLFLIPDATLIAPQPAIRGEADLYGGIVSQPFMASKAISHPLIDNHAVAPAGWSEEFMRLAGDAVLPGYSAFHYDDALRAGQQLLASGPLRGKRVQARAGRGQQVIHDMQQLQRWLDSLECEELHADGVVLEQNLANVRTYSVGQVRIGAHLASYFGQQQLTTANDGVAVYGGSDLHLVRGDYQCLRQHLGSPLAQAAITRAQRYERAAELSFPGFVASRRNCDVATGALPSGQQCIGVLEQSWRIGGASSAEIYALLAFADDPSLQHLCASSWERYGRRPEIPDGGIILYQGNDPEAGPITKGVTIKPWQPPANP